MRTLSRLAVAVPIAAFVLGMACSASADEPANSPALNACISHIKESPAGSRWPGFLSCQEAELKRQDSRLNDNYAAVSKQAKQLGPDIYDGLLKGQRQWVTYRDNWCAFEASHDSAPNPEVTGMFCKIQLTLEQADRLSEQLDELKR
jgi:uncharacterized protein YecT (DUF1311 family)